MNAIALDTKQVLPVSSYQTGLLGIEDVCLSVPTLVGRNGVEGLVPIQLWEKEKAALLNSERVLRETLAQVNA